MFFCILGLYCVTKSLGQINSEEGGKERFFFQQFELRHDNDFLHFTDRYYSTGNFLVYRILDKTRKDTLYKRQNSFYLSQEIYTPSDIGETDITKFDRPYAGYLGINYQHTVANINWLFDLTYSLGVTGPISGAEGLQNLFHDTAAEDSRTATWEGQIKNGVTINFYFNYIREWELLPNPFSVHFALSPTIAFGSKDIYLQNDAVFYFGKRNPLHKSIAYNQIGKLKNELFFAVRAGYRYVIHDTMLEGNLIKDSSVFLVEPYQNFFIYNVEMYYRRGRNDFKLFYNFNSAETKKAENHMFVTLSIARNF